MQNPNLIWKSQLAQLMGFSARALAHWLNVLNFDELSKTGYNRNQKYLTKPQLDYLFPTGLNTPEVNGSKRK